MTRCVVLPMNLAFVFYLHTVGPTAIITNRSQKMRRLRFSEQKQCSINGMATTVEYVSNSGL